jgi:hypothetical protein
MSSAVELLKYNLPQPWKERAHKLFLCDEEELAHHAACLEMNLEIVRQHAIASGAYDGKSNLVSWLAEILNPDLTNV